MRHYRFASATPVPTPSLTYGCPYADARVGSSAGAKKSLFHLNGVNADSKAATLTGCSMRVASARACAPNCGSPRFARPRVSVAFNHQNTTAMYRTVEKGVRAMSVTIAMVAQKRVSARQRRVPPSPVALRAGAVGCC